MMINQVLQLVRTHDLVDWPKVRALWLVSDCGPHFRSYENAAHFLHTLPLALQIQTHILFLGEQHGKGACDRLFGWTNSWLMEFLQQKPIHGLRDAVQALRSGGAGRMRKNPRGAAYLTEVFEPGEARPSKRKSLACAHLKITRTYSLTSTPNRHSSAGVTIRNNVFSDLTAKESLGQWSITESLAEEQELWRRGYYDKPRSWEQAGPQAGDENQLTRKFASQKSFASTSMPRPKRSLEDKLSAKAKALSRQATKRRRRREEQQRQAAEAPEDSSSSSSSSESSTSS